MRAPAQTELLLPVVNFLSVPPVKKTSPDFLEALHPYLGVIHLRLGLRNGELVLSSQSLGLLVPTNPSTGALTLSEKSVPQVIGTPKR